MNDVTRVARTKNQEPPCWRTELSNARCTADGDAEFNGSSSGSSSSNNGNSEATATEAEAVTLVTLRARSRHLILSCPFESFPHPLLFRACFRFRLLCPSFWFREGSRSRELCRSHWRRRAPVYRRGGVNRSG